MKTRIVSGLILVPFAALLYFGGWPLMAGCLFVVRQFFSDHREISHALRSAEMTGMNVLGFVFYGEKLSQSSYYSRKYYHGYYHKYDTRARVKGEETETKDTNQDKVSEEEG